MRAVDSFDVHKGFRFSTYSTLALMKGFARSVPLLRSKALSAIDDVLASVPDRQDTFTRQLLVRDEVQRLLGKLSAREREIIGLHYGLGETQAVGYDELSVRLGLTKQRVRQIEQGAIEKLRATVTA